MSEIFGIIIFSGIALLIQHLLHRKNTRCITTYLERRSASNISVYPAGRGWMSQDDQGIDTYGVKYIDAEGIRRHRYCKIKLKERAIWWSEFLDY